LGVLLGMAMAGASAQTIPADAPYRNPSVPVQQRVDDLVSRMTIAEKVSQMQNHAPAIPRLGIPEYVWQNEALHGVAFAGYATVFPQAIGMAATWDAPLMRQEGTVIGMEGRGKYNSAVRAGIHDKFFGVDFWSPNINIVRDPRWGRGQETYGEDPFLTGQLAVQFVEGTQGAGSPYSIAIATPKHFDAYSGPEPQRHSFSATVSPHDLEDTYLPAFRAAIVEGHAGSLMCAYNAVNGIPACANKVLLQKILRDTWHFGGYVVSDCGAIRNIVNGHKYAPSLEQAAVDAIRAGTDLTCGSEYSYLVQAVHDGLVQESEIDISVKRLMAARIRLGTLEPPDRQPFPSLDRSIVFSPEHARLNLRAAEESMVLLKNDGVLPIASGAKTIAVIGPNAASLESVEGNYSGVPIDPVTPLSAFRSLAAQQHFHILYAQGSPYVEELSLPVPPNVLHPTATSDAEGLAVRYFSNLDFSGEGVSATAENIDDGCRADSPALMSAPATAFSARWTGTFTPPAPGDYQFQVLLPHEKTSTYRVWFDGSQVASGNNGAAGDPSPFFTVHFPDTRPHEFRLDCTHQSAEFVSGVSFNWKPPVDVLRQEAVEKAKRADLVVALIGTSPHLEGEEMHIQVPGFDGGDRTSLALPGVQQRLLEALAGTGKPLVVVLMNGSPLAVNEQHANAILEAWFPGARGGEAIINTLLGKNNPAGRLPITFYASTASLPPFEDYSMANRTYRYFTGTPLYGFGYGLSYSHFAFSHLKLSRDHIQAGESVTVTADVTNTSKISGDEVAELYVECPRTADGSDGAPLRALAGFTRLNIAPGATRALRFVLNARALSHVQLSGDRVVSAGRYTIFAGGSQPSSNSSGASAQLTIVGHLALPE
jgi:beta-glucosidase